MSNFFFFFFFSFFKKQKKKNKIKGPICWCAQWLCNKNWYFLPKIQYYSVFQAFHSVFGNPWLHLLLFCLHHNKIKKEFHTDHIINVHKLAFDDMTWQYRYLQESYYCISYIWFWVKQRTNNICVYTRDGF